MIPHSYIRLHEDPTVYSAIDDLGILKLHRDITNGRVLRLTVSTLEQHLTNASADTADMSMNISESQALCTLAATNILEEEATRLRPDLAARKLQRAAMLRVRFNQLMEGLHSYSDAGTAQPMVM